MHCEQQVHVSSSMHVQGNTGAGETERSGQALHTYVVTHWPDAVRSCAMPAKSTGCAE
jgi:hypothetical protein